MKTIPTIKESCDRLKEMISKEDKITEKEKKEITADEFCKHLKDKIIEEIVIDDNLKDIAIHFADGENIVISPTEESSQIEITIEKIESYKIKRA